MLFFFNTKKKRIKLGMVVHACHPSYDKKHKIGRLQFRPAWAKNKTLFPE
jgi:hypothetical protein